ncbi:MAG: RICIN domain-containing protein [Chitinophagaceae bacterium]|nr:RICIN domain-containing protein [Oligoflexus sp.]
MKHRKSFLSAFALSIPLVMVFYSSKVYAAPYELGFENNPSYVPNNVIVLTFDDGPDYSNTAKVVDALKSKNAKGTFFINAENWSSISQDEPMKVLIRRIVGEGHELANHTARHLHLSALSSADIEKEISEVEVDVKNIFSGQGPRLTILRAPYGDPYQDNDPNHPSAAYNLVSPIVAKHAVHVGWQIDASDFDCPDGNGDCVYNNVTSQLATPGYGKNGIILMHAVYSQTVAAVPRIIDYARNNGFVIWSVNDLVKARYGKISGDLIGAPNTPFPPNNPGGNASGAVAPQIGGTYNLVSKNSGKCLDIEGPTTADSARAQQWACGNHQANQEFKVADAGSGKRYLVAVNSGKCIDLRAANTADGSQIQQYSCNGTDAQILTFSVQSDSSYKVSVVAGGKCLDVAGGSMMNGGNVQTWTCNDNAQQRWFFKP